MFSFIWWIIIGLIAGALARLLVPGKDPMGLIATAILGIIGSVVGGLISWAIWGAGNGGGFHTAGLLLSVVGAIVVLLIWRMMKHSTA